LGSTVRISQSRSFWGLGKPRPQPPPGRTGFETASQGELRPPLSMRPFTPSGAAIPGRVSGQTLSDSTSCLRVFVVFSFNHQDTKFGRARLPPSRDVTIWPPLCQLALLRGPIPAIPFNKPAPPAPRAAQRELRPPIRCSSSPPPMQQFTPSDAAIPGPKSRTDSERLASPTRWPKPALLV